MTEPKPSKVDSAFWLVMGVSHHPVPKFAVVKPKLLSVAQYTFIIMNEARLTSDVVLTDVTQRSSARFPYSIH